MTTLFGDWVEELPPRRRRASARRNRRPWSHPLQFLLPFPVVVLGNSDLELCARARAGDRVAEEWLFKRHRALVGYAARDYRIQGLGPDDLRSVASVAIIKAIRTYSDDRIEFERYARLVIGRDMVSEVRRMNRSRVELTNADDVASIIEEAPGAESESSVVEELAASELFRQLAGVLEPIEVSILIGKLHEKTDSEIGKDLGLSRITIWRRMQAIRQKLSEHEALSGVFGVPRGSRRSLGAHLFPSPAATPSIRATRPPLSARWSRCSARPKAS
jgi:RNA polymerase sigma factor (sigma-70 family)